MTPRWRHHPWISRTATSTGAIISGCVLFLLALWAPPGNIFFSLPPRNVFSPFFQPLKRKETKKVASERRRSVEAAAAQPSVCCVLFYDGTRGSLIPSSAKKNGRVTAIHIASHISELRVTSSHPSLPLCLSHSFPLRSLPPPLSLCFSRSSCELRRLRCPLRAPAGKEEANLQPSII